MNINLSFFFLGKNEQNIIMWMDHRAKEETEAVNALKHSAFRFVG